VWSADSNEYAIREAGNRIKVFKNFQVSLFLNSQSDVICDELRTRGRLLAVMLNLKHGVLLYAPVAWHVS
jgi:hypothetical protein